MTISKRLRDVGLTDEPGIVVQDERVIVEAADTIDALVEALESFAELGDYLAQHCPDAPDNDEAGGVSVGQLRGARAALARVKGESAPKSKSPAPAGEG